MTYKMPKTQKAIGVINGIQQLGSIFKCQYLYKNPSHVLIRTKKDIDNLESWVFPKFSRPCPMISRHGFVSSHTVHGKEELIKHLKETKKADPHGEILLAQTINDVISSAVYTSSGLLSVGPGNDGATDGNKSFSFPVAPLRYPKAFLKEVKIKQAEAVFLESVYNSYHGCFITQVRGGPKLDSCGNDYIPEIIKVKKIVAPLKDLLAWEKVVKTFESGTVVYGAGHTLGSHAAIHCIINHVPFITSREIKVGETLKPTESKTNKLTREGFRKGVCYALRMSDRSNLDYYFRYCLSILHNWAYLKNHPQADQILGVGVTLFVKLCAALAFGEYRHSDNCNMFGLTDHREDIYDIVLSNDVKYLNQLPKVCKNFYAEPWESGYGGIPWSSCAYYSTIIWDTIIKMYNTSVKVITDKEIAVLVGHINKTINLVHNNNWWFDKISHKIVMDLAAKYPGLSAFLVSNIFYKTMEGIKHIKKVKERLPKLATIDHPFVINSKGKLACAYVHPRDDAYNVKCGECGYYDCWCGKKKYPDKTTVKFWEEGNKAKKKAMIKLTKEEFNAIRKHELKNGKVYLTIIPKVGLLLPSRRIVECKDKV